MKIRIALLAMLFALAGIIADVSSASPRPQSTAFSAACSASVSGETSYVGLIQSPTSTGSFRLLRANTGGSTVVTVTYTSSVAVCQGAQEVSANSLVPGVGIAVYGHVMISGGSYKMIAQRIVLQVTNAQASSAASGAPPVSGALAQGPPPAENSVAPAQASEATSSSTPYVADTNLHPTNVANVNTAALQTANTPSTTQSGSSQQTAYNTGTSSGGVTTSTGTAPTKISCASFSVNFSDRSSDSMMSNGVGVAASSSAAITCGVPLDNSLIQYFKAAATSQSLSSVSLGLQNNQKNQIIMTLTNARVVGIEISSQGTHGMVNLVFNAGKIGITVIGSGAGTVGATQTATWTVGAQKAN